MTKIDWTKPIEIEDGTPAKFTSVHGEDEFCYRVEIEDGPIWYNEMGECIGGIFRNIRNVSGPEPGPQPETQPEALHINPAPDNFATESPIRAFTHWDAQGKYAIGKGFRPSLQHLARYLDAMDEREGWELVQILESATSAPSFVFRKVL